MKFLPCKEASFLNVINSGHSKQRVKNFSPKKIPCVERQGGLTLKCQGLVNKLGDFVIVYNNLNGISIVEFPSIFGFFATIRKG